MPMVTVSISPMQVASIRAAVENGGYASSSEVVREALRLWDAARRPGHRHNPASQAQRSEPGQRREGPPVADMLARHEAEKRPQLKPAL